MSLGPPSPRSPSHSQPGARAPEPQPRPSRIPCGPPTGPHLLPAQSARLQGSGFGVHPPRAWEAWLPCPPPPGHTPGVRHLHPTVGRILLKSSFTNRRARLDLPTEPPPRRTSLNTEGWPGATPSNCAMLCGNTRRPEEVPVPSRSPRTPLPCGTDRAPGQRPRRHPHSALRPISPPVNRQTLRCGARGWMVPARGHRAPRGNGDGRLW